MNNAPHGFTLIISVFIIAAVLMVIALSTSRVLVQQLADTVGLEDHVAAKALAEGCAEAALLQIGQDENYAGDVELTIGGQTCTIRPILSGPPVTIETEAVVSGRPYRLRVELSDTSPVTISSWERVTQF